MKVNVYSITGEVKEEIELPAIFNEEYRPDLIKRAVLSAQSARIQPWGNDPEAGKRTTAKGWGTGRGVAGVPRIKNGARAAFVPQAKGGRRAHPVRAAKNHHEKVNTKERRFAIRSAVAATTDEELVAGRGHRIEGLEQVPIIVEDELESVRKTSETREIFKALGVYDDVVKAKESKKIRAGRGKTRGRKYKSGKGPLVVVGEDKGISLGARNHAGVEIVAVENLNAELLAPGTHAGRLTIFTKSAIEKIGGLFQ